MKSKFDLFSHLKQDIPSSIVVFLVALPLCLGIALASGAPLFSGIIAGIVGGIVVAALSGSALGVSGPAAGLAVIVLDAINDLGSFEIFLVAVVLGGVIQLILGFARAGIIGYYFPTSVIKGMLTGIGIIIILKQIPHALGYDADPEGDMNFFQPDGENTFTALVSMMDNISVGPAIIAAVSMAILVLWEQPFIKKSTFSTIVQGPLVAVLAGVGLNFAFMGRGELEVSQEHLVSIPVASSIGDFLGQFSFPEFSALQNTDVYITAVVIAVVASLETLLSVEATDKLDRKKRVTPTNRELKAQGVGNIISGFIGGLPITQVIVRSSANIQSGGATKMSAIIHGFLLLITAVLIPHLLNLIPLASLAAVLFLVGFKLAKPAVFKDMYRAGISQFAPFIVTIVAIVLTDLLIGIGLGMVVAIFQILWNNYQTPYFFEGKDYEPGDTIHIQLSEQMTFLNKASILRTLKNVPDESNVMIDASKTKTIHPDVLEIIEDFEYNAESRGITVSLKGLKETATHDPEKRFDHIVLDRNNN
ncbi:MAG TPA: SulP family inorganic anion transporter [Cryomorphaceae bacterium]|nr:SulP family inorganic anion transporter [Cryomorphaceae bacterium]